MNGVAAKPKKVGSNIWDNITEKKSPGMVFIITHYWFHFCEVLTWGFSHVKRAEMVWNSPKVNYFLAFIFKSCLSQKRAKNLEIKENLKQEQ